MIFLTVGTQLPFDRLVRSVDDWCKTTGSSDIFGQIADPGRDGYQPRHFEWQAFVEPEEFKHRFDEAQFIVSHAGMGSIITALTLNKPIVIMPRRAALNEQRNDHQLSTVARFSNRPGVYAADDESKISGHLNDLMNDPASVDYGDMSPFAEEKLIKSLRSFIHSGSLD